MRLLLLDQFSDPGGAQQGLLELLPALRDRGWHAVVGMPGRGDLFASVRALGFDARPIDCGPYGSGRKSLADAGRFLAGTPRLAAQIRKLAQEANADLVYLNGPRLVPAAAMARLSAPVLFHAHSFLGPGAIRTLVGQSLRTMRAWVVGQCEFVADPWRAYVPRDRVTVVYNGIAGPSAARAHASPEGRVGCIGRIAPEKGQREFLTAAATIHRALPDCRFFVYGAALFAERSVLRYEAEVRAAAAGLPVEFQGWVEDVYEALASLDLVLVPSAGHEATTRVILEAFAAGVPVIALRSGGIPEVVDDGLDGYLADSVNEMARRAIELLNGEPERRIALSEAARLTWSRRFTLERYHQQLLEALVRAASPATAAGGKAARPPQPAQRLP